jgi:hypothetical protein
VHERDLGRAADIAIHLRALADAQRKDIVPDAEFLSHKIWAWRRLDLRAHRAADMAANGHSNREWFAREEREVVRLGHTRVTDYDAAMMRFTGEPSSLRVLVGPGLSAGGVAARIVVIITCLSPAVLIVATGHVGGIGAAIAPFLIRPLREWLRPLFDGPAAPAPGEHEESCPGIRAYRLLMTRTIESINEHTAALESDVVDLGKISDTLWGMEVTLNQMRRVVAPPLAQELHGAVISLANGYVEYTRNWIAGTDARTILGEVADLATRANALKAALQTRCP